jgi:hypothetical protein
MQGQRIPVAILAVTATPLSAQTAPPVEQAEAPPDLAVPADNLGDDRKYIIFHKPGVTVEQARGTCRSAGGSCRMGCRAGLRAVAQGGCQTAGEL